MVWGEQGGPPAGSHPPGSGGTPVHCCRQPCIRPEGVSLRPLRGIYHCFSHVSEICNQSIKPGFNAVIDIAC